MPPALHFSADTRVYAVGDVHGRSDLLARLVDAVLADLDAYSGDNPFHILLLGDLADRGPDTRAVFDMLLQTQRSGIGISALKGNHEAWMEATLAGEKAHLASWWAHGGRQTAQSYGLKLPLSVLATIPDQALLSEFQAAVPPAHRQALAAMPLMAHAPGHAFVHAGVRPGVPLDQQMEADLLWIRRLFLESSADHGAVIVHGHTPTPSITYRPNRIGIDLGAHATNQLACLVVEDGSASRDFIVTPSGVLHPNA